MRVVEREQDRLIAATLLSHSTVALFGMRIHVIFQELGSFEPVVNTVNASAETALLITAIRPVKKVEMSFPLVGSIQFYTLVSTMLQFAVNRTVMLLLRVSLQHRPRPKHISVRVSATMFTSNFRTVDVFHVYAGSMV